MRWVIIIVFLAFPFANCSARENPPVDILIFAPHPDDETLACGGTIAKAVQQNKKVKVVFLTNGDAYTAACAIWFKKEEEKLLPEDYIAFGELRQKEAVNSGQKLGLSEEDLLFLSYPDSQLSELWKEQNPVPIKSKTTNNRSSPYKNTYHRALDGFTRNNLLSDISDILKLYEPKIVYVSHPADNHSDHKAAALFINLALNGLKFSPPISYYLIHEKKDSFFSQSASRIESIVDFKEAKNKALREYNSQSVLERERIFLESFLNNTSELFYDVPLEKQEYLDALKEEWISISQYLCNQGYNVNFAPAVDVAYDIENLNYPLAKKERLYSENPQSVIELVSTSIEGMTKGGLIPVLKHFPGLGSVYSDTHLKLTKADVSDEEIAVFNSLIKKYPQAWVMVDHVIYPSLSPDLASLSYEVQSKFLREKLGFRGIIIADELLQMQAIREYTFKEKIKQPYLGDIAARVFKAGADIAIVHSSPKDVETNLLDIFKSIKRAIAESEIKEADIDNSVRRILKEKEEIFGIACEHLIKDMSLEEKICQKLLFGYYQDSEVFKRYNLGGIDVSNIDKNTIQKMQESMRIPMFVAAQHEGGVISESGITTRSAYIIGKEYERLTGVKTESELTSKKKIFSPKEKEEPFQFDRLDLNKQKEILSVLLDFMDKLIKDWQQLKEEGFISAHPNYRTPLTYFDGKFEIKLFKDVPDEWLRKFSSPEAAQIGYKLFKTIFDNWAEGREMTSRQPDAVISKLKSLRKIIYERAVMPGKKGLRILCLAGHPDDEDTESLVYFGKIFNCTTYILLATRGEGGENLISSSLYNDLGFLRMEEMAKSANILGVKKVYYLGQDDFGYTSLIDEVFDKWGKEDTLKKLVYFFRLIRPHIIITKHNKLSLDEHGQHRALAMLAEEAFDLSNNPNVYPEMIKEGLPIWRPFKFYQRSYNAHSGTEGNFIDVNRRVYPENKTIREIAVDALKQHQSQGSWENFNANYLNKLFYQLVKSNSGSLEEESFLNGITESPSSDSILQKEKPISFGGLYGIKIINNLRIGLIEKNNNIISAALKTLGYDFSLLDDKYIREGDLGFFDTIILGQEIYATIPLLSELNARLLKFVENGGNLIVFPQYYNKGQALFFYAPYPFMLEFAPLTDETSPVNILVPTHPLFNFPNKISSVDFEGWVQDRGLVFPFEYSDNYIELTNCRTPHGNGVKSGYLLAQYGKGSYIYTSYSWYRQFREFHPGAYKNLSNMLAYPYFRKKTSS